MKKKTEKTGACDGCGEKADLTRFRSLWVCRGCMLRDEVPLALEDHMGGGCALGDLSRTDGAVPSSISFGTEFARKP